MCLAAATPPVRLRLRRSLDAAGERIALRATLTAAHLLGLATGSHLRALRGIRDPVAVLQARLEETELRARLAWEVVEILRSRFDKLPERRRPFYTPTARFRILQLRNLLGWSRETAARVLLVSENTITNWDSSADHESQTVGSLVRPVPPITRFGDSVRAVLQLMLRLGFGGLDLVALTVARAGWKLSPRSVGRIAREKSLPLPASLTPQRLPRPVIARFVNHVWMMDVTQIQSFLGGELHLAGVFDAFSRAPLAAQVFEDRPRASDMARLVRKAASRFGIPKYLISDLGGEFTGRIFRKALARLGVVQRFASKENLYATARLERFWRTLKGTARIRLRSPLTLEDLERTLGPALTHYLVFRPHQGLHGATPAEAFLGLEPACRMAASPPRGTRGEGGTGPPFTVAFLDPARAALPYLAAA